MKYILVLIQFALSHYVSAQSFEARVKHTIDSFYLAHPNSVGIMVHVESKERDRTFSYAIGYSEKNLKTPLHANQPALTASNTKTYLAASILKLVEQNKLDLEQPIEKIIKTSTNSLLLNAGYQTNVILIKHLLSHTSGISDYVDDDYFKFIDQNKKYRWTRDEQIKLAMTKGKPLGMPGDTFQYADVNYLLVSEVLENTTKLSYDKAIAKLLDFKKHGLNSTWFYTIQKKPAKSKALVHQYNSKLNWDSYDLDPSWDLYGGGGIATTTNELACFLKLLFEGKIIRDTSLITKMIAPVYSKTNYCLGIRNLNINDYKAYYHGGWWGTDAMYFPQLETSIVIYVLERTEKAISSDICKQVLNIISKN